MSEIGFSPCALVGFLLAFYTGSKDCEQEQASLDAPHVIVVEHISSVMYINLLLRDPSVML
jgi:hypothetical protein